MSLALIAYGARAPSRGPSYVGAVGLASFVGLTGANVVALAEGNFDDREKLAGWPLLLLFLGLAALAVSFFLPREGGAARAGDRSRGRPGGPQPGRSCRAGRPASTQVPGRRRVVPRRAAGRRRRRLRQGRRPSSRLASVEPAARRAA